MTPAIGTTTWSTDLIDEHDALRNPPHCSISDIAYSCEFGFPGKAATGQKRSQGNLCFDES